MGQAIRFPLSDDAGRSKLVRLYPEGITLTDEVVAEVVRSTEGVSSAVIRELMRRSEQFHIERGEHRRRCCQRSGRNTDQQWFAECETAGATGASIKQTSAPNDNRLNESAC